MVSPNLGQSSHQGEDEETADYWVAERKSYYIRRREAIQRPENSVFLIIALSRTCSRPKIGNDIQ